MASLNMLYVLPMTGPSPRNSLKIPRDFSGEISFSQSSGVLGIELLSFADVGIVTSIVQCGCENGGENASDAVRSGGSGDRRDHRNRLPAARQPYDGCVDVLGHSAADVGVLGFALRRRDGHWSDCGVQFLLPASCWNVHDRRSAELGSIVCVFGDGAGGQQSGRARST